MFYLSFWGLSLRLPHIRIGTALLALAVFVMPDVSVWLATVLILHIYINYSFLEFFNVCLKI